LEGVVYRFGDRVGLQHNLSSAEIWTNNEGQQDIVQHIEHVCDASVEEMGGVPFVGSVC